MRDYERRDKNRETLLEQIGLQRVEKVARATIVDALAAGALSPKSEHNGERKTGENPLSQTTPRKVSL